MAIRFPSGWKATDQSGASSVDGRSALSAACFGFGAGPVFLFFTGGAAAIAPVITRSDATNAMDVCISQSAHASDGHHGSELHERLPGW